MQTPSGSSRCGGENHVHAGDPYIQKRSDNAGNQMHTMELKTLTLPIIIKKMKTFLVVEGKMGPVPAPAPTPAATSQFRPPLPNTNPNIRKDNAMEKRKRAAHKQFRPVASKPTSACLPLPEASPKHKDDTADNQPAPVCGSNSWPGTDKMSGNLFQDRNWLLPPNYLSNDIENKTASKPKNTASITSPRPQLKEEELKANDQEKCGWAPDYPFCKSQRK